MTPTASPAVSPSLALATALGFALLAGCGGPTVESQPPAPVWNASLLGQKLELVGGPEIDEIARLEAQRVTGDGRLLELATAGSPEVRHRALTALGRLPFPEHGSEVTEVLARALQDPEVRLVAAFALGQRADPASAGVLANYLNDSDAAFRARVVEAASRIPNDELHAAVLIALRDASLKVRIEAALATARWDPEAEGHADVDRALLDALRPYTITPRHTGKTSGTRTARTAVEAELVWRILFALARRGTAMGRGAFLEYSDSDVPLERLFAVRGLARMESDPDVVDAAIAALERGLGPERKPELEWRVTYEATQALEAFADERGLDALVAATDHESTHVRIGALDALSAFPDQTERTLPALRRGLMDLSASVRGAALGSYVDIVPAEQAEETLSRMMDSEDPFHRYGIVQACARLESDGAVAMLRTLAEDPHPLVATRAVAAMGDHLDATVRVLLHELLGHEDNGMRSAAIGALDQEPDVADAPFLMKAFRAEGDLALDVATGVLQSLGKRPTSPGAETFVRGALEDPRPYIREVARRVLRDDFEADVEATAPEPRDHAHVAGRLPEWKRNPMVEIVTTRGGMLFELFPAEAPVHVFSFLELVQRGAYDGLTFHRVVPNFVIQGGDPRGDGNGGQPFEGESLREEFGPRKYERGSLGMPRNANPDSGGSQIFVTHRPTPHLDGRYTIFGTLRMGGEVLDRVELGDRILTVRSIL